VWITLRQDISKIYEFIKRASDVIVLFITLSIMANIALPSTYPAHDDYRLFEIAAENYIKRVPYPTWQWYAGLGQPGHAAGFSEFPLLIVIIMLKSIGLNYQAIQRIMDTILFALSGVGMNYLIKTLLNDHRAKIGPFLGAMFYCVSPFAVSIPFYHLYYLFMYVYAFIPIYLANFIKILQGNKRQLIIFPIIYLLSLPYLSNPGYILVMMFPISWYFVYALLTSKNKKLIFIRATKYFTIFIFLNMFLILPLSQQVFSHSYSFSESFRKYANPEEKYKTFSTILNNFRLINWQQYYKLPTGEYAINFAKIYHQDNILQVILFIPSLTLILSSLLFNKKEDKKVTLFVLTFLIIVLILITGPARPFSTVYYTMINLIPGYATFSQNLYTKYGFHLSLAYSLGVGLFIHRIFKKQKLARAIGTGLTVLVVIALILPFFMFPHYLGPSFGRNIPKYYIETAEYINNNITFQYPNRIIQVPLTVKTNFEKYTWGYYGTPIIAKLINHPLIHSTYTYNRANQIAYNQIYQIILHGSQEEIVKLFNTYGIKYIVYNHDIIPDSTHILTGSLLKVINSSRELYKNQNLEVYIVPVNNSHKFYVSQSLLVTNFSESTLLLWLLTRTNVTSPLITKKDLELNMNKLQGVSIKEIPISSVSYNIPVNNSKDWKFFNRNGRHIETKAQIVQTSKWTIVRSDAYYKLFSKEVLIKQKYSLMYLKFAYKARENESVIVNIMAGKQSIFRRIYYSFNSTKSTVNEYILLPQNITKITIFIKSTGSSNFY